MRGGGHRPYSLRRLCTHRRGRMPNVLTRVLFCQPRSKQVTTNSRPVVIDCCITAAAAPCMPASPRVAASLGCSLLDMNVGRGARQRRLHDEGGDRHYPGTDAACCCCCRAPPAAAVGCCVPRAASSHCAASSASSPTASSAFGVQRQATLGWSKSYTAALASSCVQTDAGCSYGSGQRAGCRVRHSTAWSGSAASRMALHSRRPSVGQHRARLPRACTAAARHAAPAPLCPRPAPSLCCPPALPLPHATLQGSPCTPTRTCAATMRSLVAGATFSSQGARRIHGWLSLRERWKWIGWLPGPPPPRHCWQPGRSWCAHTGQPAGGASRAE